MAITTLPFRKMNGLGNDFVVFDARLAPIRLKPHEIARIADRKTGIGFDQMITIEAAPGAEAGGADAFMRIHNADSSEVSACGNATRCVASLLMAESGGDKAVIETRAGILFASAGGTPDTISVDMGKPRLKWEEIPLAEEFRDTRAIELQVGPIDAPLLHSPGVVNMGNPHAIFFVDDLDVVDLAKVGPMLENHPIFPERANISLARVTSKESLTLKVWERGAGLTRACGTGACAAAVAAARVRRTGRQVRVTLPGGDLFINWRESDDHVIMTGPVETDYIGELELPTLDYRIVATAA
ncbi:MAG: diaminopimelate epimerase [Hyphomicrobiaceae bacterium]|nr:diaminopimelate epimerase [Hyphomicrobiaceae bacterium]